MLNLNKDRDRTIFLGVPALIAILGIFLAFFDIIQNNYVSGFSRYFYIIFATITIINAIIIATHDFKKQINL